MTHTVKHFIRLLPLLLMMFTLLSLGTVALAQDEPITISIWASDYTPSRLQPAVAGLNLERQGIDPIVNAYQELHPNVTIQLITQPNNADTRRWLITQLTGGVAPDIIWNQPDWAAEDYRKNWLVPIDDYLEMPNPYIAEGQPGSERWHDLFLPGIDVWRAADDQLYVVLADQVQVGIYYNKDLFTEVGITEPPATWAAMMDAAQKLKDAGYFPFAQAASDLNQITWISGWLSNFFYANQIPDYDTDGNGIISKVEMAEAVKAGAYSFNDDANRARMEELKRLSTFWQPGALGADMSTAQRLFVSGRAGMFITGTWLYRTIDEDPQRQFEFDVFYFPVADSQTAPFIPDGIAPTNKAAGFGTFQFAVTQMAVERGTVDTAFDFLMFATAPENLAPVVAETGIALPAVKGAEADPLLEKFAESVSYPAAAFQEDDVMLDFEFAQKFLAITSSYFNDTQSLDETIAQLDEELVAAADRVLGG